MFSVDTALSFRRRPTLFQSSSFQIQADRIRSQASPYQSNSECMLSEPVEAGSLGFRRSPTSSAQVTVGDLRRNLLRATADMSTFAGPVRLFIGTGSSQDKRITHGSRKGNASGILVFEDISQSCSCSEEWPGQCSPVRIAVTSKPAETNARSARRYFRITRNRKRRPIIRTNNPSPRLRPRPQLVQRRRRKDSSSRGAQPIA